ncbi:MAG: leucine-rich repeat domain-containing protein [Prevotella sp.]|nr:leucine-rich repeat domain-containing protein [Prevotella sp.]
MKKTLLLLALLLGTVTGILAQTSSSVITLTTAKEYGEELSFNPVPLTAGSIQVDWGDGNLESYEMSPSDMAYTLRKTHSVKGSQIKIYGKLTELTCTDQQITGVKLEGQGDLKRLYLQKNELTYYTTDLGDAYGLTMLNLSENNIGMLNLRNFSSLVYLDLYNNPELTTVAFADQNPDLAGITMYGCDVVHFYDEYVFPSLTTLNLSNNSLWDITFTPTNYPKLRSINLSGNDISELDVSGLQTLEDLSVSNNRLAALNVAANTALTSLAVNGNKDIAKLNLQNNTQLTSLNLSNTGITSVDVSHLASLKSLYLDSLRLKKVDVSELKWLQNFSARATDIEYLDFTANYFTLRSLDVRGCKNFTAQTLNFMFYTTSDPNRSGYVYVEGATGAEQADPDKYLMSNDADSKWSIDVDGDGSASMTPVQLTLLPAEGGTYQVYRRDFVWSIDKDAFAKNYELAADGKVVPGYVNVVRFQPNDGVGYKGVKVNGQFVADSLFYVTADATIEAVFGEGGVRPGEEGGTLGGDEQDTPQGVDMSKYIKLTVNAGNTLDFVLAADVMDTKIAIDWGDGGLEQASLSNTRWTEFNHQAESNTITIYGDVTWVDVSSLPYGYGYDNAITAIDLSHNDGLYWLDAYWNQLSKIDVTKQHNLAYLDVSMNEDLDALDLTQSESLVELRAYGTWIDELDFTKCPRLMYADVKNNMIEKLDVTQNPYLMTLKAQGNYLTEIDLSQNLYMNDLALDNNELTELDLSKNPILEQLSVSNNGLTELDVTGNTLLKRLSAQANKLQQAVDLSKCDSIYYIEIRDNQWDACAVNDFFNLLPTYKSPGEEIEAQLTGTKLWIAGNDAKSNDVAHSETLLLSDKGWVGNFTDKGDGTGCDRSYVFILPTENGEVSLLDPDLNTVESGTTVKKGTELTVVATPAEGYTVQSVKANGADAVDGKFTVTRITDVAVRFQLVGAGIDGTSTQLALAEGCERCISVASASGATEVTITSLSGKTAYSTTVTGQRSIGLPAGVYVVTLRQGDNTQTQKLIVK